MRSLEEAVFENELAAFANALLLEQAGKLAPKAWEDTKAGLEQFLARKHSVIEDYKVSCSIRENPPSFINGNAIFARVDFLFVSDREDDEPFWHYMSFACDPNNVVPVGWHGYVKQMRRAS